MRTIARKILLPFVLFGFAWGLSGCAPVCVAGLAGGVIGGAAGYKMKQDGYKVQAPFQEDEQGNVELHPPVYK